MNRLDSVEKTQLRNNIPDFQPGDTVRVHVRIKESETKERLQAFEGRLHCTQTRWRARIHHRPARRALGLAFERIFRCTRPSSITSTS
jgi:large subunit ribosomal protein L19